MRKIICLAVVMFVSLSLFAQTYTVKGKVVGDKNAPIEYATIILLDRDSTQISGIVSDSLGRFSISAPASSYILLVHHLGFERVSRALRLAGNMKLEPIVLQPSSVAVEEVVVRSEFIRREADRFIVNVAGSPAAIGKDALEMLKSAPGVWVKQDDILVNGKSGCRVMINERLLNMDSDELNAYLRSIKAEDIQKIEVIPTSGADYDADTKSGVIKITLKRQRNDGLEGGIEANYMFRDKSSMLSPSFNLNYRQNKLSLYTNLDFTQDKMSAIADEKTIYFTTDNTMTSSIIKDSRSRYYHGRIGAIYDISSRQNIGLEIGISDKSNNSNSEGTSTLMSAQELNNLSVYGDNGRSNRYDAMLNYILKLDTLGSMFKLIGQVNSRKEDATNDYFNSASIVGLPGNPSDTTYRSIRETEYEIYSATADLELVLSSKTRLKTGIKFNYNRMYSNTLYEGLQSDGLWVADNVRSDSDDYIERIGSAYIILNSRIKKIAISAGLRGEYTNMVPRTGDTEQTSHVRQNYFSLFPNVNISIPLNNKSTSSLIFAYARKISRPSFWQLNPFRVQLSEYSYLTGNPQLKPTFNNDFSLTGVVASKYTMTVGANMVTDIIRQMVEPEPNNPEILVYLQKNLPREWSYYATINAPITITKWWSLNTNLTGYRQETKLEDRTQINNMFMTNLSTTVTLPKEFFVEVNGNYMSSFMSGNMRLDPMYWIDLSVKKRFFKGAVTASVKLNSAFGNTNMINVRINETDYAKHTRLTEIWSMRRINFSIRYNFKSGVTFSSKRVEGDGDNASSRMDGK